MSDPHNQDVELEHEDLSQATVALSVQEVSNVSPTVNIDYRNDWGALPPKSNPGGFWELTATVCHYTAANKGYMVGPDEDHEICRSQVRSIQQQHQNDPQQSDISYNFLVCGHGTIFEGRVLGYKGGANGTSDSNYTMPSICCLVGVDDVPTEPLLYTVQLFHAAVENRAGRSLEMLKHKEIVSTSCPGDWLSNWVDSGGFRLPVPPEPSPTPPGEQDMAPDIVQLTEAYANLPVGAVLLCSPDFMWHRHVKDPEELEQLKVSFDRKGWVFPNPIPPIPAAWMKQYGKYMS